MAKKSSSVRGKEWRILRLALLWARKGGAFRRLLMEIRIANNKLIKGLGHATSRDRIYYQERQLSFDKTPIIDLKIHRPPSMRFHIPCINAPQVDFDNGFNDDDDDAAARRSFQKKGCEEEEDQGDDIVPYEHQERIDERAEEFISEFYKQMKMQRQISYLQYTDETPRSCTE